MSYRATNDELYLRLISGDATARNELILANMPFVKHRVECFIACYPKVAHLRWDMVSEGNLALVEAVDDLAAQPPVDAPNPTGYIRLAVSNAVRKMIDHEGGFLREARLRDRPHVDNGFRAIDDMDFVMACARSGRERTLLRMRSEGYLDREIAARLRIGTPALSKLAKKLYERYRTHERLLDAA